FEHSRLVLDKLAPVHQRLTECFDQSRRTGRRAREKETSDQKIADALAEADRILDSAELFEPQRGLYRERLIDAWRNQETQRRRTSTQAIALLERWNRHVYQAAGADHLASLNELVM